MVRTCVGAHVMWSDLSGLSLDPFTIVLDFNMIFSCHAEQNMCLELHCNSSTPNGMANGEKEQRRPNSTWIRIERDWGTYLARHALECRLREAASKQQAGKNRQGRIAEGLRLLGQK